MIVAEVGDGLFVGELVDVGSVVMVMQKEGRKVGYGRGGGVEEQERKANYYGPRLNRQKGLQNRRGTTNGHILCPKVHLIDIGKDGIPSSHKPEEVITKSK
ncbi:hypothetical protein RJ640_025111 [Escallonia rubra]|uniref:Uncharacterized protein n=1 Tax=Escallonia rubra TaxID=112253 RepID=A0AA88RVI5_9ASTE|nr:hypothetical protein RJ640_025111 [Escallonia rubra]